jgi:predicted alpha-1,2-mannosidase
VAAAATASALTITASSAQAAAPARVAGPGGDLTSLVDPFVGTANGGDTFPGATMPFGMTQPSPDTPSVPAGGGYNYNDSKITGFSTVHISGPGCPALGHVSVMPVTGAVTSTTAAGYASTFSHSTEVAHPGYYAVTLGSYGVRAELTATDRTAWERYTFPAGAAGSILVNLGDAENPTEAAQVSITGASTVEGYQSTQVFCNAGYAPVTVYFVARFSRPFSTAGTWNDGPVSWGTTSAQGTAIGAALGFSPGTTGQVVAKIGISYVSVANAAANLRAEARGFNFNAVAARARGTWEKWLQRVEVTGGTTAQRQTFYTALYHALIEPNIFSDVNGQYYGMDGQVHTAVGRTEYTNLSLWDTYRTQQELLGLVAPQVARDVVLSMISDSQELGWVPRWVLANEETNTQSGDSVTAIFADALATGLITPAEMQTEYPYLVANATTEPPSGSEATGRVGIASYVQNGYVPFTVNGPYDERSAASSTLEYALADCGLSHVASRLGQTAGAARFASTAHNYRSEFDPSTGFFRPRLAGGSFLTPFDPAFVSLPYITADAAGFDEGSAWQYLWLVPQDPADLASLLGGTGHEISMLNQFFDFSQIAADPSAAATAWQGGAAYDPTDEPDLEAPYTYDNVGAPWQTQAVVRAALTLYTPAPGGIPGNDDLGELSAWYVMSALGLYPYAAGQGVFDLSAPLFGRAVVQLQRPFYSGRPLVIDAPQAATAGYVQQLTVNGHSYDADWVAHSQLTHGATLSYTLSATPDQSWAASPASAPPAFCGGTGSS